MVANKPLRGDDVNGIGDKHRLRDHPMMIQGRVKVLELGVARHKVSGDALAEAAGTMYHVRGWIDKDGERFRDDQMSEVGYFCRVKLRCPVPRGPSRALFLGPLKARTYSYLYPIICIDANE